MELIVVSDEHDGHQYHHWHEDVADDGKALHCEDVTQWFVFGKQHWRYEADEADVCQCILEESVQDQRDATPLVDARVVPESPGFQYYDDCDDEGENSEAHALLPLRQYIVEFVAELDSLCLRVDHSLDVEIKYVAALGSKNHEGQIMLEGTRVLLRKIYDITGWIDQTSRRHIQGLKVVEERSYGEILAEQ